MKNKNLELLPGMVCRDESDNEVFLVWYNRTRQVLSHPLPAYAVGDRLLLNAVEHPEIVYDTRRKPAREEPVHPSVLAPGDIVLDRSDHEHYYVVAGEGSPRVVIIRPGVHSSHEDLGKNYPLRVLPPENLYLVSQ